MKFLLAIVIALMPTLAFAQAQLPPLRHLNSNDITTALGYTPQPAPVGPLTSGNLVVGAGASQVQDSSAVSIANIAAGLTINPAASSLISSINSTQSLHGTPGSSDTGFSLGVAGTANLINITNDDVNVGSGFGSALTIFHDYGGSNMTGGRNSLQVYSVFTGTSNAGNTNHFYVGALFDSHAKASDGGTNTSSGAKGAMFGFNPQAILENGATNFAEVTGGEVNVGAQAGSSVKYKNTLSLVNLSSDAVAGAVYDTSLAISAEMGAIGVANGILFGDMNGAQPVSTSGTLINLTGTPTIANGINISGAVISGNAFASPNFTLSGNGFISLTAGGYSTVPVISFANCASNCGFYAPASGQMVMVVSGSDVWDFAKTTSGRFTFHDRVDLATNILSNVGGITLVSAALTVGASQISLGSTTSAASSCGSLTGAAGCMVINVAGTTRNVPFF